MIHQCVLAVRSQELYEFDTLLCGKTRAHADMMQASAIVVKTQQQRPYRAIALLVPAKSRHHAVAVALMFHLEHHALVRLVGSFTRLCHNTIEPGAFKAVKPVG